MAGFKVSPTPTHTLFPTIEAANITSATDAIRRDCTPSSRISGTGDIKPIISGAKMNIIKPINAITIIPNETVIRAKLLHNLYCPAP